MKKLFLLWPFLAVIFSHMDAVAVSRSDARAVASRFLGTASLSECDAAATTQSVTAARPYYIFNAVESEGFVIVAGRDEGRVVGYSLSGRIDVADMPPQLSGWLGHIDAAGQEVTVARAPRAGGRLLQTPEWGQNQPYNTLTPLIDGENAPTGCVATAMAIVMRYHTWPAKGRSWELLSRDGHDYIQKFDEYSFDYTAMPMTMTAESSAIQKQAVGTLMLAAGQAVRSEYSDFATGTNAYTQTAGHELTEKFSYSPECEFLLGKDYGWDEWLEILRGQIDRGLPVIYCGYGTDDYMHATPGHAYVVDGYDAAGMFHVNWGLEGQSNGYFDLSLTDYAYNPGMVRNIEPDRSGALYSKVYMSKDDLYTLFEETDFLNISVPDVRQGEPFDLKFPTVRSQNGCGYELACGLVDKNGRLKELSANSFSTFYSGEWVDYDGYYQSLPMAHDNVLVDQKFTVPVEPTDRIQLFARQQRDVDGTDFRKVLGCSHIPASIPAMGNTPRFSTIHYDLDPALSVLVFENHSSINYMDQFVPLGPVTEQRILMGKSPCYYIAFETPGTGYGKVTVDGRYAYGDRQVQGISGTEGTFVKFQVMDDDYYVTAEAHSYAAPETVHLAAGESLESRIPAERAVSVGSLTVTGSLDAFDFWYIRSHMPGVYSLDLSGATIRETYAPDVEINSFAVNERQAADRLPDWAFEGLDQLSRIILPENVKGLGCYALSGTAIKSMEIPAGVTDLSNDVWMPCMQLRTIANYNPEPQHIMSWAFSSTPMTSEGTLYVPDESVGLYRHAEGWSSIPTILPLSEYSSIIGVAAGADEQMTAGVYNLQGVKVASGTGTVLHSLAPGIYVVRQGSVTRKVAVSR